MLVDRTLPELKKEMKRIDKELKANPSENTLQELKEQLARIEEELRFNPPVRYSTDYEVLVKTEEGTEYIWASGPNDIHALKKVLYRFGKAGRHVYYAKVVQTLPAPRWT